MNRNKKRCDKCNKLITTNNYDKHYAVCDKKKIKYVTISEEWKQTDGLYKCPFCNKKYTKKGIGSHIVINHISHENRNTGRRKSGNYGKKGKNQYIKAKELGLPIPSMSDETKKKISDKCHERFKNGLPEKTKLRISNTIKNKIKNDEWHYSFSKTRTYDYNGIKLYGKWELAYAKYLDRNNINWVRPKEKFDYIFEGKSRTYTPDFYLTSTREYIEIKGYETNKDRAKWSHFPIDKTLVVLNGEKLYMLGIISKDQLVGKK